MFGIPSHVKLHDATENTANTSEELEVPELPPPYPSRINNQINTATKRHLQGEYEDGERTRGGRSAKEDAPPSYAEVVCECAATESKRQTPVNIEGHRVHTTSSGLSRQQQESIKVAQVKARAQVREKPKSPFVMSNEDAPATYRTRNMTIVYYDSNVQGFFYGLARFVSSNRNFMREVKIAARVAQIKKFAEQDGSEDGSNDVVLPSLRYTSSRRSGPMLISLRGTKNRRSDVYDKLDKGLEFVQSMCKNGAYQFLRDGDCNDEISKVQKRLTEVLEMAKTEMERVEREESELAKETGAMGKIRTRRPITLRHVTTAGLKEYSPTPPNEDGKLEAMDHT
ncbi:Uncharacterized protein LW94_12917 [Fusarium fujikuroi]|nr:Uncharacterized protein LW94_12917 [Fusarium fujikuroi]